MHETPTTNINRVQGVGPIYRPDFMTHGSLIATVEHNFMVVKAHTRTGVIFWAVLGCGATLLNLRYYAQGRWFALTLRTRRGRVVTLNFTKNEYGRTCKLSGIQLCLQI